MLCLGGMKSPITAERKLNPFGIWLQLCILVAEDRGAHEKTFYFEFILKKRIADLNLTDQFAGIFKR